MRLLPSRLSRYIFGELLKPTFLGLSVYTFVLLMNHFFLVAEKSLSKNLGWELTSRLFLVGIPELLVLTIPMSVLLGVLIAMGRISADREWVAMQGAGQSPWRLLRPVAAFGLLAALLAGAIYNFVVPQSNYAMRSLRGQILLASNLAADLKPRVFYNDLPGTVLYIEDIRSGGEKKRLGGVLMVRKLPEEKQTRLFFAKYGDIYPAESGSGTLVVDLYEGVAHMYDSAAPESYRQVDFDFTFEEIQMASHLEAFLRPPQRVVRDFTLEELWREVVDSRATHERILAEERRKPPDGGSRAVISGIRSRNAAIELHQRLALPAACFFFALLATPLGIVRVRSGKGAGFALSILVLLLYWAVFTLGRNQAAAGNVPVGLGTWAGNLIILPWALIGILRLHRADRGSRRGLFASVFAACAALAGGLARWVRKWRTNHRRTSTGNGDEEAVAPTAVELGAGTSTRFVSRIDQYITISYIRILLLALLTGYTIYGLVELKGLMDDVLRQGQPLHLIGLYFQYFAPGVLHVVLPISCLIGAVVTFSLLTRTGELTAIKSSGISMRRVTVPVLLITLVLCVLLFVVQDRIAPLTNQKAEAIKDRVSGRAPRTHGAAEGWGFGEEGRRLYHYELYEPDEQRVKALTVFTVDRERHRILDQRFASMAEYRDDGWILGDSWYRSFPVGEQPGEYLQEPEPRAFDLPSPEQLTGRTFRLASPSDLADQLSVSELAEQIASLEARGYDLTRLRVDYHGKFAHPLAPLVMVLLGLPFAFKVGRRGSLYGVGVALLLVLVYWAGMATCRALGLETLLDPLVAAWTPNVLFGLIGTYLMLYIRT